MLDAAHHHSQGPDENPVQPEPELNTAQIAPLLELGNVGATPGALEALDKAGVSLETLLRRHQYGDRGNLRNDDKRRNDEALAASERILLSYDLPAGGRKIWIITEWDRSVTTLLLPEES